MSLNTSTSRSTITTSKRNPSSPSPPLPPSLVLDLINHHPELRLPQPQPIITSPPRMMTPDEFSLGSWHNIDIRVPESILSSDGEELDLDGNLPHNICDALVLESEEEEEEEEQEESPQQEYKDKLIMPTMTMQSQYKPKITILSNNDVNSFVIQCLEGIADIQYSNLDTALTKRDPHTMAKTATPTNTTTNTDMVLMVNDDIDDSNKEIERQIWDNDKLNNDHGYYSYSYHDPLGVIFIDNWSLLFGFSIGLGLGMGIAFGMVSMVEKLLPQTSSIIPDASTSCPGGDGGDFNKEMNYLTSISKKIVEYIKGGWVIVLKIFS